MSRKFSSDRHGNFIAETSQGDLTFDDLQGFKDFIEELEEIADAADNYDGAEE